MKIKLLITRIDEIKNFIVFNTKYSDKVIVRHQGFIVDGKSLMGVLSLNLSEPIEVEYCNGLVDSELNYLKENFNVSYGE